MSLERRGEETNEEETMRMGGWKDGRRRRNIYLD